MVEEQDGAPSTNALFLTRGRRDYRLAIAAWFVMLVLVAVSAVSTQPSDAGSEALMRVLLWLPVGAGIGIWAARCSTVARWALGLAALVAFSLSVADVVMAMRSGVSGALVRMGLGIAIVVLSFHVLRTMVWNREAKAYALDRETHGR